MDLALDDLHRLLSKLREDNQISAATFVVIEEVFNNSPIESIITASTRKAVPNEICQSIKAGLEKEPSYPP